MYSKIVPWLISLTCLTQNQLFLKTLRRLINQLKVHRCKHSTLNHLVKVKDISRIRENQEREIKNGIKLEISTLITIKEEILRRMMKCSKQVQETRYQWVHWKKKTRMNPSGKTSTQRKTLVASLVVLFRMSLKSESKLKLIKRRMRDVSNQAGRTKIRLISWFVRKKCNRKLMMLPRKKPTRQPYNWKTLVKPTILTLICFLSRKLDKHRRLKRFSMTTNLMIS